MIADSMDHGFSTSEQRRQIQVSYLDCRDDIFHRPAKFAEGRMAS